jgi:tyrosine-protein kinase Etk/Wzc
MAQQEKKELELHVSEEVSLPQLFEDGDKQHFLEPFIVLAKHKFFILCFVAGGAILSLVVSLLLPVYYTANAKILPPQQGQSMASAMLSQLGQLGPLIGAAGGNAGIRNPNDMYVSMLRSRTVGDNMVDHFFLMSVYGEKLRVEARRKLDDRTEIVAGKDGVISISVEDRDPTRAAEMANAYIDELEKLTKTLAVTDAGKRRIFFDREMKAANEELSAAEVALKQTMETTGIIQLDNQSKVMLEAFESMHAQVVAKEVQVQSMRSFATPENPDLIRAEQELAALRTQVDHLERGQGGKSMADIALEKVPGKGLEYIRKLREVKYRETLFELLAKQYEAARIDEAKDMAIIQALDSAVPPEKRSWPKRGMIVLSVTLLAALIAVLWAYTAEAIGRAKEDPQYLARLQLLKMYLTSGRKTFMR